MSDVSVQHSGRPDNAILQLNLKKQVCFNSNIFFLKKDKQVFLLVSNCISLLMQQEPESCVLRSFPTDGTTIHLNSHRLHDGALR